MRRGRRRGTRVEGGGERRVGGWRIRRDGDILLNGGREGLCRLRIWFLLFRFRVFLFGLGSQI